MIAVINSWKEAAKSDWMRSNSTKWTFMPPLAPHMGGLHEAAVKSAKHHLKRAIGAHQLTFEQLVTILVHTEACLNSRPLTALNDDANDCIALTPAHFLIGESVIAPLTREYSETPSNRLNHFKLVQKLNQDFWHRWSNEYVTGLMQRNKWYDDKVNVKIGAVVLMHSDQLPPTQWPLGRITSIHPGKDNRVRIVDVLSNGSTYTRPINKICVLPTEDEEI